MRWRLLALLLLAAPARAQPEPNRIYALRPEGFALLPLPVEPGVEWRVEKLDGARVVRDWAPADPGNTLRLPPGGWYRLQRREPDGRVQPVGGRFAAGYVILITGQSQADAYFISTMPQLGAFRARPEDPAAPPVHAVVYDCLEAPGCGPDRTIWGDAGENFGARLLLAELSPRLGGVPIALAAASYGGASAAQLADPQRPEGDRLRRVVRSAAPASAALILAHGTTDSFFGTAQEDYLRSLRVIVDALRQAGLPGMPVLQAPLSPLEGSRTLLGSSWLGRQLPAGPDSLAARLGLVGRTGLPASVRDRAEAMRAAQARAAAALHLLPGGDMSGVELGPDGVHWSRRGIAQGAHEAALALAAALRPPRQTPQ